MLHAATNEKRVRLIGRIVSYRLPVIMSHAENCPVVESAELDSSGVASRGRAEPIGAHDKAERGLLGDLAQILRRASEPTACRKQTKMKDADVSDRSNPFSSLRRQQDCGAGWPKAVHAFGNELRRIAPQLGLNGLSITLERRSEARIVTLRSE